MANNGRHYPNLTPCRVILRSSTDSLKPPVRLPQECLDTVKNTVIPPPYDFALERAVLRSKEVRDIDSTAIQSDSREELEKTILMKMKSVTNADETICIALLEENHYDVKTSIEAFFQSS